MTVKDDEDRERLRTLRLAGEGAAFRAEGGLAGEEVPDSGTTVDDESLVLHGQGLGEQERCEATGGGSEMEAP